MEKENTYNINIFLISFDKEKTILFTQNLASIFQKRSIIQLTKPIQFNPFIVEFILHQNQKAKLTIYTDKAKDSEMKTERFIKSNLSLIQTQENCDIHLIFILYSSQMQMTSM